MAKMNSILISIFILFAFASAQSCTDAIMAALNDPAKASAMLMATGKSINDLGDYDMCKTTEGLRYTVISGLLGGFQWEHLGVCVPEECQKSDMQIVADALQQVAGGLITVTRVDIQDSFSVSVTPWRALGFVFFSIIGLITIMGAVVEFTPLFNKAIPQAQMKEDVAMNKTIIGKALISFSPHRNLKKLFYSPFNANDNLRVFNGVRLLSMLYVVLGHAYLNVLITATANSSYLNEFLHPLWFQVVPGGFFAVDVFFYLSAFLGAYLMITKFNGKKCINFGMIYFHRFYRLAPNVLILLLMAMTFYEYLGSGPVWAIYSQTWISDCPKYWWAFVTFVNSVYPKQAACVGWLWYLSNDFIFYLTLPFQVVAYINKRIFGYALAILILIANLIIVIALTLQHNLGNSVLSDPTFGDYIYYKPWSRIGAFQIGVIMAMMYYEYVKGNKPEGDRSKIGYKFYNVINLSRVVRYACYTTGLGFILFCVFAVTPENRVFGKTDENGVPIRYYGQAFNAFYNATCRPLYVFGLALILAGPLTGKGSFLQVFLGSRFYAPWAKISFYAYLIHLFVFTFYYGQMRSSTYLSHISVMWVYVGVIFLTLTLAVFFSVLLEAPWMQLEKLVLFPPKKKVAPENLGEVNINYSELKSTLKSEVDSSISLLNKKSDSMSEFKKKSE
jgi:peptidoglycan/LPS O-acetylase OafA/YrhL